MKTIFFAVVTKRANGAVGDGGPTLLKKALLINVQYDTLNIIVTFRNYIDIHVFYNLLYWSDLVRASKTNEMSLMLSFILNVLHDSTNSNEVLQLLSDKKWRRPTLEFERSLEDNFETT